ncbi:hypothetical protein [Planktothrix sp.]
MNSIPWVAVVSLDLASVNGVILSVGNIGYFVGYFVGFVGFVGKSDIIQ